jgi:spermidine synthase
MRREEGSRAAALAAPAVLICFFLSGATSLIYEVVWMRMLVLIFGSSTLAVSTILAAFMGGLALGSFLAGRFIDRRGPPLALYGVLEGLVGLYALLIPFLFRGLSAVSQQVLGASNPSFATLSLSRLALSSGVLLLPTVLMGATLPILARYFTPMVDRVGFSVGGLYGINTLGAAVGTFLAGFYLLPRLGVQATLVLTASINIGLGLLVLGMAVALRASVPFPAGNPGEARPFPASPRQPQSTGQVALVMAAFALSGFAAMVYEVAWTRALTLIIGNSVYAFSVMLVTFLVGLAGGSLISSLLSARLRLEALSLLGIVQGLIAITAFVTTALVAELPYLFTMTVKGFYWSQGILFTLNFMICFAIMFLPTLCMGAFFPLVVKALATSTEKIGRWVGDIYSVNTVGAILGALVGGFLLIPGLGIQRSLLGATLLNLLLALLLVGFSSRGRIAKVVLGVLLVSAGWSLYRIVPPWEPLVMAGGVYVNATAFEGRTREEFRRWMTADRTLLYERSGNTTTVTVVKETGGNIYLSNNGKVEASSEGDMPTQVLLAQLPLLLHDHPEEIAVIGFGSGTTIGSVLVHPVKRAMVVELEGAVVEASRFFDHVNNRPLAHPRLEVITDDGRNHLLRTSATFDVIISEPSNPWISGVASLFTRDFFELGRRRLKPDGLFAQWLSMYGLSTDNLRSLIRTFHAVFPNALVFETLKGTDLVLIGSTSPITMDVAALTKKLASEPIAADLGRVGIPDPYHLLAHFRLGSQEVTAFAGEAPLNTDDNMLIEFSAPRWLHSETSADNRIALLNAWRGIGPYMRNGHHTPREKARLYIHLARASFDRREMLQARSYVKEAVQEVKKAGLPPSEVFPEATR